MPHARLPRSAYHKLANDLTICRLLHGMWQVSGSHGTIVPQRALATMLQYYKAGFTSWDLADQYGPAEDFIGAFRRQLRADRQVKQPQPIQALTKWAPRLGDMSQIIVRQSIEQSLLRMHTRHLDLLQFHWWDYRDKRYLDALKHLADLQSQGIIRHLGVTNFDAEHLQIVLEHGIPIVSNQVQFSLVDQRPLVKMVELCQAHHIQLLAYGTLCGGLLTQRFCGQPEPTRLQLNTPSLRKYKSIIAAWGGWDLLQELMMALEAIGNKYNVSMAAVAIRYVLEQPTVAGTIVGARLGISDHLQNNAHVFEFALDDDDREQLFSVCDRSNNLFTHIGDCGNEYRD